MSQPVDFRDALALHVPTCASVDQVIEWLEGSGTARSVIVGDYWIKTEPPCRELTFTTLEGKKYALSVGVPAYGNVTLQALWEMT